MELIKARASICELEEHSEITLVQTEALENLYVAK